MDQKAKARERSEHYQDRILAALRSGPLSAMDISAALENEINITSVAMYLRIMEKNGLVYRECWQRHPGADIYAIWAMTNKSQMEKIIDRTLKITKGIDIKDIEWMKFWRLPSAKRRQIIWGYNDCE